MRLEEAAKELGVSTRQILRLIKSGKLSGQKVKLSFMHRRVKEYPQTAVVWEIPEDAVQKLKAKRG